MKNQLKPNAPRRCAARPERLARRGLRSALLAAALFVMASTVASARTETLRWTHSDPSSVAGFIVYYGLSSANYTTAVDAPALQPNAQGIFTLGISVPDDATIFVAVTAYGFDAQESLYSNEGVHSPGSSVPTPTPDPSEPDPVLGKPGKPYVVDTSP
jgi:hypothetical protein